VRRADRGEDSYFAARAYALASVAFQNEPIQQKRYADRAVELLGEAKAAGYLRDAGRIEELKQQPDLQSLQPRPDFRKFLDDLVPAPGK
jgi:hypothetical protein